MRIYLDDDSVAELLVKSLRRRGHDVQIPADHQLTGKLDAIHLAHAIRQERVLLSRNHPDFEALHNLLMTGGGHHTGIFIVRSDDDPARDMSPRGIASAIEKLTKSGVTVINEIHILN